MQAEILTAELADYPFESFEADAGTLKAYIPQEQLADCKGEVDALLTRYGVQGRYIAIETQNWNAVWESNFPPVDVEGRLLIRAPFHEPAPAGVMEVVVMPKMSFGTGHHATTWLVSRARTRPGRRRPSRARYGQRYGCAVDRRRQMRCRPCRCGRHRRLGRRQLPREHRFERRRRPHRTDAGRRAPHRPDGITALSWPISTAISSRPICRPMPQRWSRAATW